MSFSRIIKYIQRRIVSMKMRLMFVPQFLAFRAHGSGRFQMRFRERWPCFNDATTETGFDKHYIYHTAWASRILAETRPSMHVDIASSLYFCANISAFVPMEFFDYRPVKLELEGLTARAGDILALPMSDDEVESISCMHVIEHVGLGRYGEPLDYDGDLRAARELSRVTAVGGRLLVVVPVGKESRIQFNAHRIYSYSDVVAMFPKMRLEEFALIAEDGREAGLARHGNSDLIGEQRYACGCFLFTKLHPFKEL